MRLKDIEKRLDPVWMRLYAVMLILNVAFILTPSMLENDSLMKLVYWYALPVVAPVRWILDLITGEPLPLISVLIAIAVVSIIALVLPLLWSLVLYGGFRLGKVVMTK